MNRTMLNYVLSAAVALSFAGLPACSTKKTETTTRVTTTDADPVYRDDVAVERTTETTTKTTTDVDSDGCGGVLSCTLNVVGSVLALPFRLVGGLIEFLF